MPKISELFDPEKPGSVKLTSVGFHSNEWFQPFYKYERDEINTVYCGLNSYGVSVMNYDVCDNWQLWQEPKKTKIVYEWMYNIINSPDWAIYTILMSEEAAKLYFDTEYKKTGRQFEVEE